MRMVRKPINFDMKDHELKLFKLPYFKPVENRMNGFSKSRLSCLSYYLVIGFSDLR